MRILVISNLYPPHVIGGYEQACRDVVDGLRERGHHVEVLTSTYGVDHPTVESNAIYRLLQLDPFWDETAYRTESAAALFQRTLHSNRYMRMLLQSVRPDVVYVWSMLGVSMSLLTTAQRAGIPIVLNIQDSWLYEHFPEDRWLAGWNRQGGRLRAVARLLLQRAVDRLIPTYFPDLSRESVQYVSKAFANIYAEKGYRFPRECVIYNGIDVSSFIPRERNWSATPHKLLFLGRLDVVKGAHVAIEALALLGQQLGRGIATLTVVGSSNDVSYVDRLHRLVYENNLADLVEFRDAVPRPETSTIYAAHELFLFPSSWAEGFSLALLEALACGLPTVGTATGGSAEILEDEITGLIVPPEDAAAIARQIARLIEDPALAQRLSEAGVEVIHQRFDQGKIIEQVERFLHHIVGIIGE